MITLFFSNEFTTIFVDVPSNVYIPPILAAYTKGINSLEGARPIFCAQLFIIGLKITIIGVLLINAKRPATGIVSLRIAFL